MKKITLIDIILLIFMLVVVSQVTYSQYKDGISVVQFSAEFVKENEISLKKFNDHNTHLFYLTLKLPEDTMDKIEDAIDEILENTF
jgi:hypothetical protein